MVHFGCGLLVVVCGWVLRMRITYGEIRVCGGVRWVRCMCWAVGVVNRAVGMAEGVGRCCAGLGDAVRVCLPTPL